MESGTFTVEFFHSSCFGQKYKVNTQTITSKINPMASGNVWEMPFPNQKCLGLVYPLTEEEIS